MPELKAAISNTGPLISALQCGRVDLLRQFYDVIHIPAGLLAEFERHGASSEIRDLVEAGFIIIHHDFIAAEKKLAEEIAEEIVRSSRCREKNPAYHLGEAEAIVLMNRPELEAVELLIDELAAREVAEQRGIPIIGFPGVLVRACRQSVISPEEVREALLECRRQGTHYAETLIEKVYSRLREEQT